MRKSVWQGFAGIMMLSALTVWSVCAQADTTPGAVVSGVRFEPTQRVANVDLQLNGAGLRKKLFISVYAMGLYVPSKAASIELLNKQTGPRRILIATLRDLSGEQFEDALVKAINKRQEPAKLAKLQARLDEFSRTLLSIKTLPEGARIQLDWLPDSGTVLTVNGTQQGKPIAGEDFYQALLDIWLGGDPIQDSLKTDLLAKP